MRKMLAELVIAGALMWSELTRKPKYRWNKYSGEYEEYYD